MPSIMSFSNASYIVIHGWFLSYLTYYNLFGKQGTNYCVHGCERTDLPVLTRNLEKTAVTWRQSSLSERFAAGDEFIGRRGGVGVGRRGAAGNAQSNLRLATSNYLPEGRDMGGAAR